MTTTTPPATDPWHDAPSIATAATPAGLIGVLDFLVATVGWDNVLCAAATVAEFQDADTLVACDAGAAAPVALELGKRLREGTK
jgi:hypothetical protein